MVNYPFTIGTKSEGLQFGKISTRALVDRRNTEQAQTSNPAQEADSPSVDASAPRRQPNVRRKTQAAQISVRAVSLSLDHYSTKGTSNYSSSLTSGELSITTLESSSSSRE